VNCPNAEGIIVNNPRTVINKNKPTNFISYYDS